MDSFFSIVRTAAKFLLGRGVRRSYSQDGEDLVIRTLLPRGTGTYVDVGAYHPMLYSNTFRLYTKGWSGIVVDPNESMRAIYKVFRPRDRFISCGIARTKAEGTYHRFADGAYNTFSSAIAQSLKDSGRARSLGATTVPLLPLREVLAREGLTQVDFLSVDVEGMDLEVLESHDWTLLPKVIAVEDVAFDPDRPSESKVYAFLKEKGYRLAARTPNTLIFDQVRSQEAGGGANGIVPG